MPAPGLTITPERLFALFSESCGLVVPPYEYVRVEAVPDPYRSLLVHEHHMTVTIERHYGGPVGLRVLARHHAGDDYARAILLVIPETGQVVQFGIMHLDLSVCEPAVRDEIIFGRMPLGRILIEHDVLRRIEPLAYLRIRATPQWLSWFQVGAEALFYGRLAEIHCNGRRAVELLEVVRP
jgi:hypothetical protein